MAVSNWVYPKVDHHLALKLGHSWTNPNFAPNRSSHHNRYRRQERRRRFVAAARFKNVCPARVEAMVWGMLWKLEDCWDWLKRIDPKNRLVHGSVDFDTKVTKDWLCHLGICSDFGCHLSTRGKRCSTWVQAGAPWVRSSRHGRTENLWRWVFPWQPWNRTIIMVWDSYSNCFSARPFICCVLENVSKSRLQQSFDFFFHVVSCFFSIQESE